MCSTSRAHSNRYRYVEGLTAAGRSQYGYMVGLLNTSKRSTLFITHRWLNIS